MGNLIEKGGREKVKLVYSKDIETLPVFPLPKGAVMIGISSRGVVSDITKSVIVTFILNIIVVEFLCFCRGRMYDAPLHITLIAAAIFLLMIPPHELLHILALEKSARKNIIIVFSIGLLGVYFPNPIKKRRYLFIEIFPNILLGILPLVVWLLYPENDTFSQVLLHYAFFSMVGGAADYRNVLMVLKYVPKDAMVQNVLTDGYWFMESEKINEK